MSTARNPDLTIRTVAIPAAPPPLLPPLTAVQRAWVSAVAAMMPSEHRRQLHAWAERRWGAPRWATLGRIATAVWQFRIEGGVMPDNDRGRTHSASCATCRSWDGFGDGWGECVRPDERWNAEMADLVPPTLIRVVLEGEARVCDEHCLARLHTESRFGCRAWEPRSDSEPQDAPESAQGPDTPGRGLPSRGGPFPLTTDGVLYGQGDGESADA